ncbi:MAG: sulfatase [Nitrospinae bacterium]|nr:sulfatase [Nitrospinota bacterium]
MKNTTYENLIMITLDCVRPDFLGCYGNPRVSTPNIDRLASRGMVFEQAISQAPCTWVSHGGIFTGTYPPVHGLRAPFDSISGEVQTLAEVLSGHGFNSAGFPANSLVGSSTGLHRGFDLYFEDFQGLGESGTTANRRNPWSRTMKEAGDWLEKQKGRFFLWLHYLDTHHLPELDLPEYYKKEFNRNWQFYEGKISYADHECVGKILYMLEQLGFSGNTLVVIFSDHGEDLMDDGCPRHNGHLADSVLRVPLIFASPGGKESPMRFSRQARSADIMPSVLGLLGVPPSPSMEMDGKDLFEKTGNALPFHQDSNLAYAENMVHGLAALRSGEWKFVKGNSETALYHLSADPRETRNALAGNPLTGNFFEYELERISRGRPAAPLAYAAGRHWTMERDRTGHEEYAETLAALKSLGYM